MNLKTIFKRLVLLDLLISLSFFAYIPLESKAVTEANEIFFSESSNVQMFIGVAILIIYPIHLINLYLLYKFKSIGKQMYLILFILAIILLLGLFDIPTTIDMGFYILDGLGWSVSGAILVLLYFSPIKKEFEK